MKSKTVPVKNVMRLAEAGEALIRRPAGMPGMGIVDGETGFGKTTATAWYRTQCNGVVVRAMATWTPAAMLGKILTALGRLPRGSCAAMMDDAIEALTMNNRPLFIDEGDYIINSKRMVESLRDIHDMATVPVVLIGMGGFAQRLAHLKQLTGRIMQEVHFQPLDEEDAALIAKHLCEVQIQQDLIEQLTRQSMGSTRLTVVGLARIEQYARSRGLDSIGCEGWGRRQLFTGEAPDSNKPGRH